MLAEAGQSGLRVVRVAPPSLRHPLKAKLAPRKEEKWMEDDSCRITARMLREAR